MALLIPSRFRLFILISVGFLALLTISLRIPGLTWGVPGMHHPNEPMFHPDELSTVLRGIHHYRQPDRITFSWGGAFYYRLSWVASQLSGVTRVGPGYRYRKPLIVLRVFNLLFSLLTVFAVGACSYLITKRYACSVVASSSMALFPGHILDSGFARGDTVLVFLCSLSLLLALRFVEGKNRKYAFSAALVAGLAISTMSWGVICLVALAAAVMELLHEKETGFSFAEVPKTTAMIALGAVLGYLCGSFESIVFFSEFLEGWKRAMGMHGGSLSLPVSKLTTCSFLYFSTPLLACAYAGLIALFRFRPRGTPTLMAYLGSALLLLSHQHNDMVRYVGMLAPVHAIAISYLFHLVVFREGRFRPMPLAVFVLSLSFCLQIDIAYLRNLSSDKDIRYRVGDYLAERSQKRDEVMDVVFVSTFVADYTYQPRFTSSPQNMNISTAMLYEDIDVSAYLNESVECVVVSDYARTSKEMAARLFFKELDESGKYRMIRSFSVTPVPFTIFSLLEVLDVSVSLPGDYYYHRLSFQVYERLNNHES